MQSDRRIDISMLLTCVLAFVNVSLLLQIGSLSAVAAVEPRIRHLEGGILKGATIRQGPAGAPEGLTGNYLNTRAVLSMAASKQSNHMLNCRQLLGRIWAERLSSA
jgi:hypothetical protein